MAAFLVIGRRKVKFRFFVFLALLLSAVFCIYTYLAEKGSPIASAYTSVDYGEVRMTVRSPAVIIRKESMYTAPSYGKAVPLAANGAAVQKDQPVAVLYKESYDPDKAGQLYTVQEKITQYQQNQLPGQVLDGDMEKLKTDSNILVLSVQEMIRKNDWDSIAQKENQLRTLLAQKQKLLDLQTKPDSYLKGLYNEEADIRKQMKAWTVSVKAPETGLISFQLDGYENILGIDTADQLTKGDFKQILEQPSPEEKNKKGKEAKAEQPFFRMVDPHSKWYAVVPSEDKDIYFNTGEEIQVSLEGKDPLPARICQVHRENGNSFFIMEFSGGVEKVMSKRILPIHIQKSAEGLCVPEKALMVHDGKRGVFLKNGSENLFIEVTVRALSNGQAVVESVSDNLVLKLHDQVMTGRGRE